MPIAKLSGWREPIQTGFPTKGLITLAGYAKTGKTKLALAFPGCYLIECEPNGADRLAGRWDQVKSIEEFNDAFGLAVDDDSIQTIAVDTIDAFSIWLQKKIAHKAGVKKFGEPTKGVNGFDLWNQFVDDMNTLIHFSKDCGKLVLFLAHCSEPKLDKDGNIIKPMGINIPGDAGKNILHHSDAIIYLSKQQVGGRTEHRATARSGAMGIWGTRIEQLADKEILLPKDNPFKGIEDCFKAQQTTKQKEKK